MKKRLLCLMLLCSMVLSMLPVPVLAEDAESEAFVCICDTACTESSRNPDCPVCGAEGAHLHDCALYEDAHEPEAEDEEPFEEEEPEEEEEPSEEDPSEEEEQEPEEEKPGEEPSEEDPTEKPENPEQPQDESENEGEDGELEDEEGLDNAVDTLELTGEDMIRVYSGETMSDELYDSLSRVTFTLSASEYQCGEAGHTGSITDICINSVDLSDWDANRKIKVNFDISFQCDTPGCPRRNEMKRRDKTRTFTDSDSCHTAVSATANYRKACSNNNNDLIVLTLTSDKSIAYKEYFSEKEATCTEAGYEAYWMCGSDSDNNKCRKIFSDEECTKELTAPVTLPAKGHDFNSMTAHYEAKPATCVAEGNIEYWQCYQCKKLFDDDKGTTERTTVKLPVDPDNHAQKPVYRVDELSHVADYACCNKTTSARHTFEGGVCECGFEAPFLVYGGGGSAYYGSADEAIAALNAGGATSLEIVKSYSGTINVNISGSCIIWIGGGRNTEVSVDGIRVSGGSVSIRNHGTVGKVHQTSGTVALIGYKGGMYETIETDTGTVGEMLGSVGDTPLLYKTADGEYLRADNEACKASTISNVQVMFPPLIYVEITGAGNSSGERHDYKYALTVKAGETVTLKSGAYELGQTDRGSVTTEWNCGRIPEENIDVQFLAGGARSVLTLTNLTAGEYTLVCTSTANVGAAGYSVRATVKLTVESDETDTRAVLKRDTTYTTGVSRSYNGTNICNELHEVTYLDGENKVVLTNWDWKANCTIEAYYDSAAVGDGKTVTVTITLSDEMAEKYKFENGTTTDTFTIAGTINKAFPDVKLNLLKTEFMTGEKLCDTLTISGVMEEAAVTYRYAVHPMLVNEEYDSGNPQITEDTVINEAGSYWVYATTAETANYKPEFTPSVKITVLCTVTFDANGGTLASEDSTKAVGYGMEVTYGELPTTTRQDYRFDGWFTEKDGGDPVDADTLVMQATDHTLYAHWTANQKMIHVDETSLHTKSYDGMTGVDLNRLAGDLIFRDESGNDVTQDVQGKFTVTEASFNSPNFFGDHRVTGKMEIREAYAAEFQLDKTEFTIKGKIDKAVPTLTGLELKLKKRLYAGDSFGWNFDNNNLSGGTATITAYDGSVITVPGTFTFDEGELRQGSPLKGGENRLPVRFDPKDVANVEEAACEVVVNVFYRNYDCVSASYLYPAYGTAFKDLDLPDSVTVNARYDASDGGVGFNYYADITWDASKYDPTNLDEQIMYGTFDRQYWEDYIAFPEGADVRVKLVIKVQPPVQAETEITELPTFQWTKRLDNGSTFKLPENTIFVDEKFTVGTYYGQTGTLTGGKARIKGTDTELSGTFALEFPYGQTETFYSEAGTKEVTVVFKPENSLFYAEARATLSVEAIKLTLAKMYNTVSITDKDVGTQFADLGLPTSVGFETEDGTVKFISVEWNAEGYNRNSSAEQTITGTLKYDSFDERELNPTTLTATATVKLIPPAHVHAYTQKVQKVETLKTPASCTEDAVYYLSCECGEISPNEADVFIAENTALDHDFGDWTTNGDGTHTRTCKRYNCTAFETDSCSGGTATCVEKAVCRACKAVYGELGAHVFSDEWTIDRYQHWHVCTVCRAKETERLNHFDQDDDHLCDTCGYQITDHTFGTDWSMDETSHWHACSMCGAKSDEAVHTDANKDHACDVCGKTISNHVDTDKDHVCDYCEKTISNHVDANKDHVCDYCEKTISNHEDANKDHVCDYCEKTISNHVDANNDHICDYCEKTISNHVDTDKDHICDDCGKTISNHLDADNDHRCDFCERLITNHADENRNHICDICEKVISNHTGGEATCTAKAVCELCGKAYGEKDPANHTGENRWTADDKTHEREWTCCGVVTVETEAHTFGKWVTTVKPTSHKKGEKERTCEVCGYTQTKTVSPTGGSGTTDSGKKPATGTDDHLPFDDVRRGDWFYDDVRYVYETGLMNGTANRIFAPSISTTRAMIVTILWRLEGSPVVNFAMRFRDVVENAWYSEAVRWAAANGIVTGYSENAFGPNDNITREQLAAILHRYAKYKGLDVSAGEDTNILSFDDAQTISGYAVPAMQWACGAGLMQGSNRKLLPTAQATRAQVAAMLHRFLG